MRSEALAEYLRYKRFWQNLGLTIQDISELPERQTRMLDEIMSIESQYLPEHSKK